MLLSGMRAHAIAVFSISRQDSEHRITAAQYYTILQRLQHGQEECTKASICALPEDPVCQCFTSTHSQSLQVAGQLLNSQLVSLCFIVV